MQSTAGVSGAATAHLILWSVRWSHRCANMVCACSRNRASRSCEVSTSSIGPSGPRQKKRKRDLSDTLIKNSTYTCRREKHRTQLGRHGTTAHCGIHSTTPHNMTQQWPSPSGGSSPRDLAAAKTRGTVVHELRVSVHERSGCADECWLLVHGMEMAAAC